MLVVLGIAIYVAAATSLAASGTRQLQSRLDELSGTAAGPVPIAATQVVGVTSDPSQPGLVIGGDASGTVGFVLMPGPDGTIATGASGPVTSGQGVIPVGAGLQPMPLDAQMQAAVAAGETVVRETTIGTAPVRLMAAAVPTPGGSVTALVFADRTAELDTLRTLVIVLLGGGVAVLAASVLVGYVYAGRALVPIRESLRRQREFTADASHELRTPLSITRAAIAELRRGRSDPATVDRALDDLDAGAARMELLVDDLLLLARTDADAVTLAEEDTDLALAAAEAAEALEPVAAARGIRLVLDIEPAPLRGDETRLRQLAGILVDNAIRHSPDGGRVTVTVRPGARLTVDDEGARHRSGAPGQGVRPVLACPRRAGGGHGPGPGDRQLDRGAPWGRGSRGEPRPRAGRALRGQSARERWLRCAWRPLTPGPVPHARRGAANIRP